MRELELICARESTHESMTCVLLPDGDAIPFGTDLNGNLVFIPMIKPTRLIYIQVDGHHHMFLIDERELR